MFSGTCTLDDWNNKEIMQHMFKLYLKKHVPRNEDLWHRVLYCWYNQKSTIIEIKSFIRDVYNDNHEINMRELRAWRVILEAIGCKNITPFEEDISNINIIKKLTAALFIHCLIINIFYRWNFGAVLKIPEVMKELFSIYIQMDC